MQKIKKPRKDRVIILHALGAFAWGLIFILVAHPHASAQSFIQSYNTSAPIQQGIIVQLEQNPSKVLPASQNNAYKTFGVVVDSSDAPVSFSNPNSQSSQVFVTSSGHYNVLVSDQNGPINSGNYITLSSVDGVGMNDNSSEPIVVGQAITSFSGGSNTVGTDSLKNSSGGTQAVHLGIIQANISIAKNPLIASPKSSVPGVLQRFTVGVAGKEDPAWRIYLGLAVLVIVAILTGTMIYSAVRNSLVSIGRNPLSKQAIKKGFLRVVLTALIIFISGIFGVYLLLKV